MSFLFLLVSPLPFLIETKIDRRNTAFSWHFENNGSTNDWSLTILEVSCWRKTLRVILILSRSCVFHLPLPPPPSEFSIRKRNPNKYRIVTKTLRIHNLFIWNTISVIMLFIRLSIKQSEEKAPWKFFLPEDCYKKKKEWKIYIDWYTNPFFKSAREEGSVPRGARQERKEVGEGKNFILWYFHKKKQEKFIQEDVRHSASSPRVVV